MRAAETIALLLCTALAAASARAQQNDTGEIHGLKLGQNAATMTLDGFGEFACGGNGGPARGKIDEWSDFKKCRAEPSGLREVAVRFDDQEEYVGHAFNDDAYTQRLGTRVAGHPVLLSVLFDENGVVRGIRFISDPRGNPAERRMAHLLRLAVREHYDPDGWSCVDTPPADGQSPVGGVFVNQTCAKNDGQRAITIEAHFFRRPGQNDIDPVTKKYTSGQFESMTRVEIMDPNWAPK